MDRAGLRTLGIAAAIGVPVAAAVVAFEVVLHGATELVWHEVPHWFDWDEPAAWYVIAVPALAGLLVGLAMKLPGRAGHSPLEGLGLEAPPRPIELPSLLLAAVATLAGGLVLGPEAPILALGLVIAAFAGKALRAHEDHATPIALAGAFAAIAGLFGGPLVTSLMLFEIAAAGGLVAAQQIGRLLLPGLVAAATGALIYTGVGDWPGVGEIDLALPGLPEYDTVRIADLAWCIPIAVVVAVLVVAIQRGAAQLDAFAKSRRLPVLVAAGALVGVLAVVLRATQDRPVELVLFSGQGSAGAVIAEGSAGVLAVLIVCKLLAYGISLGAGFRGGPIFPAIAVGIAAGALAANVLPGLDVTPGVIAGMAAGAAAGLKLPFTGALMTSVLAGSAAADVAPIAIISAVAAWVVAMAAERVLERPEVK